MTREIWNILTMQYFLSRKQLHGSEANIRNSRRSEAHTQTKKCRRRNVLTHFLSPKLCATLSLVVICVILQIFHLCKDNGDIGCGLNFGNNKGRNLSQNNASNRQGDKARNRERRRKTKETFLNSPLVEEKEESGGCRYEELETILGGSYHSNESDNKTYYVSLPEDESKEQSEDESEVDSEGGQSGGSDGDRYRESEEQYEDSDEEQDHDEDDYEEIEMLRSRRGFPGFGKSRKQDDEDFIRFDVDESFSEDSDTDSDPREMLTEEELDRRLKGLRGNLDDDEMIYLWNSFHEIENNKFQVMQRHLWEWCELLAFEYKIPEDTLLTEWKRIVDFSSDELMKKTVNDYRDFKNLINGGLKNSMDFVHFLNSKRESWSNFRSRTESVWKNTIDKKFRNYYN
ncbi:phist protein [Plasmodium cynomolgi strain B]|uniref:Phist protein n=1 Tax=Plasmodium cynomolgi (strain B) TaxID=1120755 RepID=K6UQG7_PLACD|nr:phist protein [Plasmodium cynomolgi strain B]GAB65094.1 phist protein [Plasmodium cynomolgi strain B]